MLNLDQYSSLGEALREALDHFSKDICLIEADRDRENCRLTYAGFKERALAFARAIQDGGFAPGSRAAIIMSNQSKWLISAYAVFFSGGVVVPLDFKLSAAEQLQLLWHCQAGLLITEYHLWRALTQATTEATTQAIAQGVAFRDSNVKTVLVTEAPAGVDLMGARRWEEAKGTGEPSFVPRTREDAACIVYSSGTGGRPKGCVLTHGNYLEQCKALSMLIDLQPGMRFLSILPTNHAIDFMGGFIWPFVSGATVVHLRTLRPEFIREAFTRYKINYVAFVPMLLKSLEKGLRDRFDALPLVRRILLHRMIALNRMLTRRRPRLALSRFLLADIHKGFGGELRALVGGGAFSEPATLQFFYDLGIQVVNGYGLTEAGTAITLSDLKPFRADTVGKPLPGTEIKIINADAEGIGEVAVRGKTVMAGYLDDTDMTAETIVDGWLMTGDLGRIDASGHLQLFGRKKNMIVTEGGKNIYPEDIETAFEGLPVKEFCIFAANFLWPRRGAQEMLGEKLVIVLRLNPGVAFTPALRQELESRNRRLPDFKRVGGYLIWNQDFPRTASLKIKRGVLAGEIARRVERSAVVDL
jgi:long-chain acyl-CoA synthetase